MIKLIDLLEIQKTLQPGEEARMRNFTYGGTMHQSAEMQPNRFNVGSGGTVEEMDNLVTNHPENKEYQVGKSWEEPNLFEDNSIQDSLLGRELQTLEDLGKMASRLRQAGYTQSDIDNLIADYMTPREQMGIGYAMKVRSADTEE